MTVPAHLLDEIRARLPVSECVRRHGITLKRAGREWRGFSPFNAEHSPSFFVNDQKGFYHCFSANKHGDIFAFEQEMTGSSFPEAVKTCAALAGVALPSAGRASRPPPKDDPDREAKAAAWAAKRARAEAEAATERARQSAKAAWLWARREPITEDSPPGLYLRSRRGYLGVIPATLAYLPARGDHGPAMIAAFGLCDEVEPGVIDPPATVTAIHLTKLTADGDKVADAPDKIVVGQSMGAPIVLAPMNDSLGLAITEGIESGLSIFARTGLGVWVAGAAGRLLALAPLVPHYADCITIWADDDKAGRKGATDLADALLARGFTGDGQILLEGI